MSWSVSVFMSYEDMRSLKRGNLYASGNDALTVVKEVLNKLGLPSVGRFTCATVSDGRPNHPAGGFGEIEARLRLNTVLASILVVTDGDLQDVCNKTDRKSKRLSSREKKLFFIPSGEAETTKYLAYLANPSGGVYPEVRISRAISIQDITGFFTRAGDLVEEES